MATMYMTYMISAYSHIPRDAKTAGR